MNILGIGIDIVQKKRIQKLWLKYKLNFAKKILNKNEIKILHRKKNKLQFLTKSFAAKEAFVKALGTGFRKNIIFKKIILSNNYLGKPIIQCNLKPKLSKNTKILISISHEKDITVAFVIIMTIN